MTETLTYDVFISHAFEDKSSFANELAVELTKAGLKVWYSGFELKLGDSISSSVNKALKSAAFGIVIISPIYFKKQWAMNELNALFAQETGQNRILPILHNITVNEVKEHFPVLADRYTIPSTERMDFIIQKIWQAMAHAGKNKPFPNSKTSGKQSGEINHAENYNSKDAAKTQSQDSSINKNTNTVTVNTGNGKLVMLLILLILAISLYFLYENQEPAAPAVNKSHTIPSNSN